MKKFLLAIAAATLMAGNVFADEATFTCKTDLGSSTVAVTEWKPSTDFSFTFDANKGTAPSFNRVGDIRLYANNTATLTANNGITVTKVVFTISTQGKKRLGEVAADLGAIATQAAGDATVTWTGSASTIVFTVDPNGKKALYGSDGASKAAQLDFDAVTITYSKAAGDKLNADMAFAETTVTATLGEDFTAPALTKATDGAVTYTSSVETVATVAADGAVTLVGAGTTVIKAAAAATDKYYAGSAEYTLVVTDPAVIYSNSCMAADCGFTATAEADLNPWTIDSRYGLKATGYANGSNNARDGVMASPVLDLEGRKNITLGFETAVNMFKGSDNNNLAGEAMAQILDFVSVVVAEVAGEEMPAEWTKIGEVTLPESQSWSYIAQDPAIDLNAYAGKKVRIGFRYVSTEACAGTWEVKNVVVKGEKDQTSGKLDADLFFSAAEATANLGEDFSAPVLTKSTDATIEYTSSDENVATVDANGNVTLLAAGTTTITATAPATDKYYGGTASYILTVVDNTVIYSNACMTDECGFTAVAEEGLNPWTIDSRYGLKATGYANGSNNARDGVMASPVLDLTARKDITLAFETAVNMFKGTDGKNFAGEAMAQILDYVSVVAAEVTGDEMPAEWTKVADVTLPASQSWTFIAQNPAVDLNAFSGKKVRIGFRYVSTEACAGTWEVKNVLVKGTKKSDAIDAVDAATDAPATYYNLQGVRVANPTSGLYIVVRGNKVAKQYIR